MKLIDYLSRQFDPSVRRFFSLNAGYTGFARYELEQNARLIVYFESGASCPYPPVNGRTQPTACFEMTSANNPSAQHEETFYCDPDGTLLAIDVIDSYGNPRHTVRRRYTVDPRMNNQNGGAPEFQGPIECKIPTSKDIVSLFSLTKEMRAVLTKAKRPLLSDDLPTFCQSYLAKGNPRITAMFNDFFGVQAGMGTTGEPEITENVNDTEIRFSTFLKNGRPDPEGAGPGSPAAVYTCGDESTFIFLDASGRVIAFDKNSAADGHQEYVVDSTTGTATRCSHEERAQRVANAFIPYLHPGLDVSRELGDLMERIKNAGHKPDSPSL